MIFVSRFGFSLENLTGQRVDLAVVFSTAGFELHLVDFAAMLVIQIPVPAADVRRSNACVLQRNITRFLCAEKRGGCGRGGVIFVSRFGFSLENLAGQRVDLAVVFSTAGFELDIIDHAAVFVIHFDFRMHNLAFGKPCGSQGDGQSLLAADISAVAGATRGGDGRRSAGFGGIRGGGEQQIQLVDRKAGQILKGVLRMAFRDAADQLRLARRQAVLFGQRG